MTRPIGSLIFECDSRSKGPTFVADPPTLPAILSLFLMRKLVRDSISSLATVSSVSVALPYSEAPLAQKTIQKLNRALFYP
jgi:hypothetical protein